MKKLKAKVKKSRPRYTFDLESSGLRKEHSVSAAIIEATAGLDDKLSRKLEELVDELESDAILRDAMKRIHNRKYKVSTKEEEGCKSIW
jgi:hypothetical protein